MAKVKSAFFCQNCGNESPKWVGKCTGCNQWNTLVEEKVVKSSASHSTKLYETKSEPILINEIVASADTRIQLPDSEFNRVLGGGIVTGSLTLLGGEPGIGKSTLMLQLALRTVGLKVLYVSGEESEGQLKMRAERIGISNSELQVLTETSVQVLLKHFKKVEPQLIVIDSIQTLRSELVESAPGSVAQVRESTAVLQRYAKENGIPIVIIGHINKDGMIAGPKVLEHMVDTVLQFEGDRNHFFRIVRAIKNRFGATPELAIYEMAQDGLNPVLDPSRILAPGRETESSGVATAATMEGMRPMLIESQALVSSAVYGTPQRSTTGFDLRRLNMLLAVLEKRCGFRLGAKDVFLNIAGGLRVDDPAIDLAVCCAVLSSSEDLEIPTNTCFAGEIGLSGEIRPIGRIEQRVAEASKLGMKRIFIPKMSADQVKSSTIEVLPVGKIDEVFRALFG
ncbi:MAG: DNA repair protein RadA/Sms [Bacteroidia bacterium]|jgi:DNA repair protein RadA/Sms